MSLRSTLGCPTRVVALAALLVLLVPAGGAAQEQAAVQASVPRRSAVSVDYGYQEFTQDVRAWHSASVAVSRRAAAGTLIGRVNFADRFARSGVQAEADAYPRLGSRMYGYFNLGYSAATIFPRWRSGAELFAVLPRAYEVSVGLRQLRFDGVPVTLLTGSAAKYVGNYLFTVRPYLRSRDGAASASMTFSARRYGSDADRFIGARIGFGSTPSDVLTADQLARTSSASAGLHGSQAVGADLLGTWSLGYERERLARDLTRKSATIGAGLKLLF